MVPVVQLKSAYSPNSLLLGFLISWQISPLHSCLPLFSSTCLLPVLCMGGQAQRGLKAAKFADLELDDVGLEKKDKNGGTFFLIS